MRPTNHASNNDVLKAPPVAPSSPCRVCGVEKAKHGTFPTCCNHDYASIDDCVDLQITRIEYRASMPMTGKPDDPVPQARAAVRSYWEPNRAEREAIFHGAKVVFECWGHTHPPMILGVSRVDTLDLVTEIDPPSANLIIGN